MNGEEFLYPGAIRDKEGVGSIDIRNRPQKERSAFQRRKEGVVSQSNREKNQDTPIQDNSSTGPALWLRNMEDHKGLNIFQYKCPRQH